MVEDVDGNKYLDFMAGIAVSSTGYNHPKVVAAVQEQAGKFLHICGSDFYFEGMANLCERLARLAPGPKPKRVFLTNSGTEAVEGAIKLARYYTGRKDFIAFKGAFHGRSTGALALTSSKVRQRAGMGPFLPGVHHVDFPYAYRCENCRADKACSLHSAEGIERDLFARHVDPSEVAAVFVEPVQGEGGYIVPPAGWMREIRELCDRHGILLVADEVQSGVGRTGKMWAIDHMGVAPDIMLSAKGLGSGMPIGAIIAPEEITTWKKGAHGSTFGGNPVCVRLRARDPRPDRGRAHGERAGDGRPAHGRVEETGREVPGDRGRPRARPHDRARVREGPRDQGAEPGAGGQGGAGRVSRKGLLLLGAGPSALRFAPPLVVDEYDVDTGLAIVDAVLAKPT